MKKSSDNSNRPRKLEEVFRDGFKSAEVEPRASIWHRIEQDLEVKQTGYYKKRLVWYRSVAAASITLLLVAISYFWYDARTGHRLNLPGASSPEMVQNNSNASAKAIAKTGERNDSNQPTSAGISKKKQPAEKLAIKSPSAAQPALSPNSKFKNTKPSPTPEINLKPSSVTQKSSPQPALAAEKSNLPANEITFGNTIAGENSTQTQKNDSDLAASKAADKANLPADSLPVLIAESRQNLKHDSITAITAALTPAETKKSAKAARWALGGGTGSQYFEQSIKFANAVPQSFSNAPLAYSNSVVSKNGGSNTIQAASKEFNENTRSAFSYRAAVAANYRINDKWSIEAGLNFAENKAQTTTSYIIYKRPAALNAIANIRSENLDVAGKTSLAATNVTIPVTIFLAKLTDTDLTNASVSVDKVEPFNMYYRYRQIGVPVRLRYQHGRGKWFTFVQAGGALNVLLQTSILSDSPKVPTVEYSLGRPSPFRKWYVTALSSVGRGLKLSEVWQIQGSLDVARSFSTITLSPDQIPDLSQRKPYYVGFGISSSYIIGKDSFPNLTNR